MVGYIPNEVLRQGRGIRENTVDKVILYRHALFKLTQPLRPLHTIWQIMNQPGRVGAVGVPKRRSLLMGLPEELLLEILGHLHLISLCRLALTCKRLLRFVDIYPWIVLQAEGEMKFFLLCTMESDALKKQPYPSRYVCHACKACHPARHFDERDLLLPAAQRKCLRGYGEVHLSPQYSSTRNQLLSIPSMARKETYGGAIRSEPRVRPHNLIIKAPRGIWSSRDISCATIRYGQYLLVMTKWFLPTPAQPGRTLLQSFLHRYGFLCPHVNWDFSLFNALIIVTNRGLGSDPFREGAHTYQGRPTIQCAYCPIDFAQGDVTSPGRLFIRFVITWRIIGSNIENPRDDEAFASQQQTESGRLDVGESQPIKRFVPGGSIKRLWDDLCILRRRLTPVIDTPSFYVDDLEHRRRGNLGIFLRREHWSPQFFEARLRILRAAKLIGPHENCYKPLYQPGVEEKAAAQKEHSVPLLKRSATCVELVEVVRHRKGRRTA
ncbi:hypothetical protein MMC25_007738 [Agyrium rufum]|nr:hypothetical protein [Agyrium rufum]